ncbi:hypothetical protein E2320_013242 [Naja naja]|nr:hypothetical protein E2320_013242 [Naja naja]
MGGGGWGGGGQVEGSCCRETLPKSGLHEKSQRFSRSLLASPPRGPVLGYPCAPTPTPRPLFLASQEKKDVGPGNRGDQVSIISYPEVLIYLLSSLTGWRRLWPWREAAPSELGAGGSLPVLRGAFTSGGGASHKDPFALKVLGSAHCGQAAPPAPPPGIRIILLWERGDARSPVFLRSRGHQTQLLSIKHNRFSLLFLWRLRFVGESDAGLRDCKRPRLRIEQLNNKARRYFSTGPLSQLKHFRQKNSHLSERLQFQSRLDEPKSWVAEISRTGAAICLLGVGEASSNHPEDLEAFLSIVAHLVTSHSVPVIGEALPGRQEAPAGRWRVSARGFWVGGTYMPSRKSQGKTCLWTLSISLWVAIVDRRPCFCLARPPLPPPSLDCFIRFPRRPPAWAQAWLSVEKVGRTSFSEWIGFEFSFCPPAPSCKTYTGHSPGVVQWRSLGKRAESGPGGCGPEKPSKGTGVTRLEPGNFQAGHVLDAADVSWGKTAVPAKSFKLLMGWISGPALAGQPLRKGRSPNPSSPGCAPLLLPTEIPPLVLGRWLPAEDAWSTVVGCENVPIGSHRDEGLAHDATLEAVTGGVAVQPWNIWVQPRLLSWPPGS